MLSLTDIKTGKRILWNGEPYIVLEYQHSFLGRGGAVMRTKLKNLVTGAIIDYTFQDKDKFDEADVVKSKAQYLYRDENGATFMNMDDFDQFSLSQDIIGNATDYLLEGTEVTLLSWENKPIAIEMPIKVTLEVKDAPPGIKGDTASGGDKVVTLETGIQLTTPLFIKTGDKVIVNTEKGSYVSRV